ncbi:acyl-CoA dehydrogenase family protein [Gordonia sp. CPCC 206044]|uniref:acyl-CoA dehydrogenase family protein n=1 Tax=Gordonia sp. CPCC 206044 TaxID=3140793 RepID=UPI003AF35EFF
MNHAVKEQKIDDSIESVDDFVRRATEFLDANLEPKPSRSAFVWGEGEDGGVKLWEEPDSEQERARLAESREWRQKRFDAGFGWIDGARKVGGAGLTTAHLKAYRRLEAGYQAPSDTYFKLDSVLSPVIREFGSESVRDALPRALYRGEIMACELFSEPDAGSDLFSARTAVKETEGGWLLQGQKVWTSDAHLADIGIIFARTGAEAGKNSFSAFILDMKQDGVTVVPLRQMTGGAAFNEVFLDNAFVPTTHLLGSIGEGWTVVRTILALERAGLGAGLRRSGSGLANGTRLTALVRAMGAQDDPLIRQELVRTISGFWAARQMNTRGSDRRAAKFYHANPAPLLSKLALSTNLRRASELAGRVLGAKLTADTGEWGTFSWNSLVLGEPGVHIFAGTDEIIRNSAAEKVLGLPRD